MASKTPDKTIYIYKLTTINNHQYNIQPPIMLQRQHYSMNIFQHQLDNHQYKKENVQKSINAYSVTPSPYSILMLISYV